MSVEPTLELTEGSAATYAQWFAVRNAVDPAEAYRAFRGRDARIDALMRDRGFPVADAKADGSGGTVDPSRVPVGEASGSR